MRLETPHRRTRTNENIRVIAMSAEEQAQRVHGAVAQHAYELFETHKQARPQQVQDWMQAESEVVHPFCGGRMPTNGNLWIGTDPSVFKEGSIEVWVAPDRVTLCGVPRAGEEAMPRGEKCMPQKERIYEVIDLREEVEPSHVAAKVKNSTLEIVLEKAKVKETEQEFKAAA